MDILLNKIKKNFASIKKTININITNAFRLYDKDIPEYPLRIDIYKNNVLFYVYEIDNSTINDNCSFAKERNLEKIIHDNVIINADFLNKLSNILKIDIVNYYIKYRKKKDGKQQYEKLFNKNENIIISENNLLFEVNLSDYLDTGIFLDHRIMRKQLANLSNNKCILNLFSYTGSASVYAANANAQEVISVDLSNTYMDWTLRNFNLNKLNTTKHKFLKKDVLQYIDESCYNNKNRFDVIFLDPPSFSNSKSMNNYFDIQEHHETLINKCIKCLADDGILLFSNNLRNFKMSEKIITEFNTINTTNITIPNEFNNKKIHNSWKISNKI